MLVKMNYENTTTHDFRNYDREICVARSSLDILQI